MTLDGTNTWVLTEPGASRSIVVDPGPDDDVHLAAILAAVAAAGTGEIGLILLTHGHPDHAEGLAALAQAADAPVRAVDPALCRSGGPLVDGERLELDGLRVDVVATPGHTPDSACLLVVQDSALLTGDTLLGRGSTVVAHPEGRLADYLDSLRKLRSLVEARQLRAVLPGHGPVRDDPAALVDGYLAHREERLEQVRSAIAGGAADSDALLRTVYADVDPDLLIAARWSLLAQLDYLKERGEPVPPDVLT
jgi:glyoxylase-like metal-dependent hydrolase (beta-lactamase superfamily II)